MEKIITVAAVFAVIPIIFLLIKRLSLKKTSEFTNENFVVMYPRITVIIGIMGILIGASLFGAGIYLNEIEDPIFYVVFGVFILIGIYLLLKSVRWKIVVSGDEITIHPVYGDAYTFSFSDIASVKRQVSGDKTKPDKVTLKTNFDKRIVFDSMCVSYHFFVSRLKAEVNSEYLSGFDM